MSLREEMWKYEQITGESAEHVPIIKIGAFLDGYEMGLKALEQEPKMQDCEHCSHSEEQDGSNCYECVKGMADNFEAQPSLNKLDDIITKAIDESENQIECQTLRWVLDEMSELPSVVPSYNSVNTELKPRTNLAETSQDTISREDAINLVHDLAQPCDDNYDWDIPADEMIDGIKDLPSVTSQPKVGKWIKTYEPNDAEPCILWECSECKNVERGKRTKYCPNCGSYNGGEEE